MNIGEAGSNVPCPQGPAATFFPPKTSRRAGPPPGLLLGLLLCLMLLPLSSCSSSDSSSNGDYTDGDGYGELTAAPTVDTASTGPGSTVVVHVPVDQDTTFVTVTLYGTTTSSASSTFGGSYGTATRSASEATLNVTMSVSGTAPAGTGYVQVTVTGTNGMGTDYVTDTGGGNYTKNMRLNDGSLSATTTAIAAPSIQITTTSSSGSTISTTYSSPTSVSLNSQSSYTLAAGQTGYFTFTTQTNTFYGFYVNDVANSSSGLTLYATYDSGGSGTFVSFATASSSNQSRLAFRTGATAQTYVGEIVNNNSTDSSITVYVRKGLSGGQTSGTATALTGSAVDIGSNFNNGFFSWQPASTSATFTFTNLAYGVDVTVYDTDGSTVLNTFSSSSVNNTSETFNKPSGLTASSTYYLSIRPTNSGAATVGTLTIGN